MAIPAVYVKTEQGKLIEIPEFLACGMDFTRPSLPAENEYVALPEEALLIPLEGRIGFGYDPILERAVQIREIADCRVVPLAAALPSEFLPLYRSATSITLDAPPLAPMSYTTVGSVEGKLFVTAIPLKPSMLPLPYQQNNFHISDEKAAMGNNVVEQYFANHRTAFPTCRNARKYYGKRGMLSIPLLLQPEKPCSYCSPRDKYQGFLNPSYNGSRLTPSSEDFAEVIENHLSMNPENGIFLEVYGEQFTSAINNDLKTRLMGILALTDANKISQKVFLRVPGGQEFELFHRLRKSPLGGINLVVNSIQDKYLNKFYSLKEKQTSLNETLEILQDSFEENFLEYLIFPGLTNHPEEIEALQATLTEFPDIHLKIKSLEIDPDKYFDELKLFNLSREHISMKEWFETFKPMLSG